MVAEYDDLRVGIDEQIDAVREAIRKCMDTGLDDSATTVIVGGRLIDQFGAAMLSFAFMSLLLREARGTEGPSTAAMAAIGRAIEIAEADARVDGAHHKAWVIDQMVRALVGVDYEHWLAAYEADGATWDPGVAP